MHIEKKSWNQNCKFPFCIFQSEYCNPIQTSESISEQTESKRDPHFENKIKTYTPYKKKKKNTNMQNVSSGRSRNAILARRSVHFDGANGGNNGSPDKCVERIWSAIIIRKALFEFDGWSLSSENMRNSKFLHGLQAVCGETSSTDSNGPTPGRVVSRGNIYEFVRFACHKYSPYSVCSVLYGFLRI